MEINSIGLSSLNAKDETYNFFTFGCVSGTNSYSLTGQPTFSDTIGVDLSFISEGKNAIYERTSPDTGVPIPTEFDPTAYYIAGDRVLHDGKRYKFKQSCPPGDWSSVEPYVEYETYWYSLQEKDSYQTYTVSIISTQKFFNKKDLLIRAVSGNESIEKRTNAEGKCTFSLNRSKVWKFLPESKDGYHVLPSAIGTKSNEYVYDSKVSFTYMLNKSNETSELTVKLTSSDSGTSITDSPVAVVFDDISESFRGKTSGGSITFSVPNSQKCTVCVPIINGFASPTLSSDRMMTVITNRDKTVEFVYSK